MRYVIPVVSVAVAFVLAMSLQRYGAGANGSVFLAGIIVSAWLGGGRSAAIAIVLSLLAFDYYILEPTHSLAISGPQIPRFIMISTVWTFVGWVSATQKRTTQSLKEAHGQLRRSMEELRTANETLIAEDAERRRAEDELRQAQADLTRVSRVTAMGELTASLAHEVNQPIAAAVLNATSCTRWLAGDPPNIEEARAAAKRIVEDGTRAAEIVNRVRMLFTKGVERRDLVDVNDVVREMTALLGAQATRNSVAVRLELEPDDQKVVADRVQLQQVMMNLMMNAIDAMKDTHGARDLTVRSQRNESDELLVSVSDTGAGLPLQRDQIFKPFFTTKADGIGMGLSISRSIVESHGGRLWAENGSGHGTTFHFTLPFSVATEGGYGQLSTVRHTKV